MTVERKVVLVTGASRGIGAAIADDLGCSGHIVIGTATTEAGAEKISQRFADNNISGRGMALNVTEAGSIEAVLKSITDEFGAPTVLVNNAGITRDNIIRNYSIPVSSCSTQNSLRACPAAWQRNQSRGY